MLIYRLLGFLFGLPAVLVRSDLCTDAELLVLRHENEVLRRQLSGRSRGLVPHKSHIRQHLRRVFSGVLLRTAA